MFKISVLALLLAATSPGPWTEFPELVFYAETDSGSIITIQKSEVRVDRRNRSITVWMRSQEQRVQPAGYQSSISRQTYFCDGYSTTTAYTTYKTDGSVVDSWDNPSALRTAIRPGTVAAAVEAKLCDGEPFL